MDGHIYQCIPLIYLKMLKPSLAFRDPINRFLSYFNTKKYNHKEVVNQSEIDYLREVLDDEYLLMNKIRK